jgi:hypothetical protein
VQENGRSLALTRYDCEKGIINCRTGTMATTNSNNVDYRLLDRLNKLVICSRCLRAGRVTPIPQLFSAYQRPRNLCPKCRAETGLDSAKTGQRRKSATVLQLRR